MFLCIGTLFLLAVKSTKTDDTELNDLISLAEKCSMENGYYPVKGKCDSYVECNDEKAHEMLCPDGLHFNPAAQWPDYPCGYPMDISCKGRGEPQPAISTEDCPNQYGFFPSALASPKDCGQYRMCVEGRAIEMVCPPGLAFNPDNARCDWPDLVPTCDADAFLGFKCPKLPMGENGKPANLVMNFKLENDCVSFYSCARGHARLLTCETGFAFDPTTGECEDSESVACDKGQNNYF